jgi:hypothetical protein
LYDDLTMYFTANHNFKQLRVLTQSLTPPAIPYIGTVLRDLMYLDDIYPNESNGKVNFIKRKQIGVMIREIQTFYSSPMHIYPVAFLRTTLKDIKQYDEAELIKISLEKEKKEQKKSFINLPFFTSQSDSPLIKNIQSPNPILTNPLSKRKNTIDIGPLSARTSDSVTSRSESTGSLTTRSPPISTPGSRSESYGSLSSRPTHEVPKTDPIRFSGSKSEPHMHHTENVVDKTLVTVKSDGKLPVLNPHQRIVYEKTEGQILSPRTPGTVFSPRTEGSDPTDGVLTPGLRLPHLDSSPRLTPDVHFPKNPDQEEIEALKREVEGLKMKQMATDTIVEKFVILKDEHRELLTYVEKLEEKVTEYRESRANLKTTIIDLTEAAETEAERYEKFKQRVQKIATLDDRIEKIEKALGIEPVDGDKIDDILLALEAKAKYYLAMKEKVTSDFMDLENKL